MNTPSAVGIAGRTSRPRKCIAPSQKGISLLLFMFDARYSKLFKALSATDTALIGQRPFRYSGLIRLFVAVVSMPIGLAIGSLNHMFAGLPVSVVAVGGILGLIYSLVMRYGYTTRRYLKALDIVSGSDLHSLSFSTAFEVTDFVQNLIDTKVAQIKSLHRSSLRNLQERDLLHELEGQLIELVRVFDGVDGIYTGPARELIIEYTVVIGG